MEAAAALSAKVAPKKTIQSWTVGALKSENQTKLFISMVSKIEQLMQKLETMSTDPTIIEVFKEFQNEIIQKDQQIQSLRENINYLSKKTNEQERYSSKNCVIVSNLPLVTGTSYSADVILFLKY